MSNNTRRDFIKQAAG